MLKNIVTLLIIWLSLGGVIHAADGSGVGLTVPVVSDGSGVTRRRLPLELMQGIGTIARNLGRPLTDLLCQKKVKCIRLSVGYDSYTHSVADRFYDAVIDVWCGSDAKADKLFVPACHLVTNGVMRAINSAGLIKFIRSAGDSVRKCRIISFAGGSAGCPVVAIAYEMVFADETVVRTQAVLHLNKKGKVFYMQEFTPEPIAGAE